MPATSTDAKPTITLIPLIQLSTIGVTTFVPIHVAIAPMIPSMVVMAAVTPAVIDSQMDVNTALIVSAAELMPSPIEDMTPLTVSAMDEKTLDTALTALWKPLLSHSATPLMALLMAAIALTAAAFTVSQFATSKAMSAMIAAMASTTGFSADTAFTAVMATPKSRIATVATVMAFLTAVNTDTTFMMLM